VQKEEIMKMSLASVIWALRSPWALLVVLVTKKDGTTRFCVNYHSLNCVMKRDSYLLLCG
jgi:hypothetical protein